MKLLPSTSLIRDAFLGTTSLLDCPGIDKELKSYSLATISDAGTGSLSFLLYEFLQNYITILKP